ncbi:MAG: acyl-CoA thioesterase [Proteobacteria bacterium]|nr:acyl-CoA thioesterase [Pseudomonadota bacterium]
MKSQIDKYPVSIEIPIAWGEMDSFQHVNNIIYFRYFESSRIHYFTDIEITRDLKTNHIGPILAHTDCRYKIPLTYPDSVISCSRVREIREMDFIMEYAVFSKTHNNLAAEGTGRIVMFNYETNQKVMIPETVRQGINQMEGRG